MEGRVETRTCRLPKEGKKENGVFIKYDIFLPFHVFNVVLCIEELGRGLLKKDEALHVNHVYVTI